VILNLVDRWGTGGEVIEQLRGASWSRLGRLAGQIGGSDWPVDVVLVADDMMSGLNRRYRDGEGVTDVLSFSYLESEGTGPADLVSGTGLAPHDLWCPVENERSGAVGELVLAPAFIGGRCRENGWPVAEEIPLLVVHGCLHLLGWDHMEPAAQNAMQAVETTLLAGEGLSHPLLRRS
jgi:probable rRNA maturation factor